MDFLHNGYHDQVQWATDACKLESGSMPNLSNCGYFFINLESLLRYIRKECGDFVHIWYSCHVLCVVYAMCLLWYLGKE